MISSPASRDMAGSGDIDRLCAVLDLLSKRELSARRIKVGDIELELAPRLPPSGEGFEAGPGQLTPEEAEREAKEEYERIQYGASEGRDYS